MTDRTWAHLHSKRKLGFNYQKQGETVSQKSELIDAIRNIDRDALLEKNPRRPFDNAKTIELFLEEVIRLVETHIVEQNP